VIPIIKPLPNTTVDFTKTIGNLYYQEGNHQNLIDKKIIYFLERVRNEYLIDTAVLDENFIKKLHAKTGKEIKDIEHLVYLINYQKKSYHQSIETDLIEINKAIEKIIS
jgi:enoyl-[acyl-carrier-protein] reductase (NADH)